MKIIFTMTGESNSLEKPEYLMIGKKHENNKKIVYVVVDLIKILVNT